MEDRERGQNGAAPSRGEKLALLYQGILTVIVRVQSGKQPINPPDLFQKRMEGLLDEIEREAVKVGYRNQDIKDAHYAVVAFLDEAIQRSNDPNRLQWQSLQAKLYSEAVAGEGVFDRLKTIRQRRDSIELTDLLEVYYLCFLLGYEGQYALGRRSELERLMDDLRDHLERIRGRQAPLSPEGALPDVPQVSAPQGSPEGKWRIVAIACAGFAFTFWITLWLVLHSYAQGAVERILVP